MNTLDIPKTGFAGLKAHFKNDLVSGFSVSLIALPLCLGIAIASGMPPLAGLLTAIVGGMIASRFSGTFVTISGPAAGLIVINLGAVESLGGAGAAAGYAGYPHALGAILIGGAIVAVFGFLKIGKIGDYFPTAAVHGMLAAIGLIIIIKQFFPAIGVASPSSEILEAAYHMPESLLLLDKYAVTISGSALLILIAYPFIKIKAIKAIPGPMWVLLVTIPLAAYLGGEAHLKMVKLPDHLLGEGGIQFPSFAKIGESAFWLAVTGVALVSAIESLLSAKAVDSLDPYKRKSNLNKDLISMGAGSSIAAAIGGLPMISEIVRSSANVNSGAKTQWANFFHGTFLLIYLLIGASIIEMIPVAALAAMLVYTGFKLASPKEFKHMFQIGLMELEIFIVTIIAVLATDLIIGIATGIVFKYILLIFKGAKPREFFKSQLSAHSDNGHIKLMLYGFQIFSNYLSLKKHMDKALLEKNELILDFSNASFVDHTVMDHLEEYARSAKLAGKTVLIKNIESLNPVSAHPLASRDKEAHFIETEYNMPYRTLQLFSFASNKDYLFQNKAEDYREWEFYKFSLRKKIVSVENVIVFKDNKHTYQVADMIMQMGAGITADLEKVTVIKVSCTKPIPQFYLHRTTALDVIKESLGNEDINFSHKREFSKKYVLRSTDDEAKVRAFFSDEMIDFLNQHDNNFISSNGKCVLLYMGGDLLNISSIKTLIKQGEEFGELI